MMKPTFATPSILFLFAVAFLSEVNAKDACEGLEAPDSVRGCFCFLAPASEILNQTLMGDTGATAGNNTAGLDMDMMDQVCFVAAKGNDLMNNSYVPVAAAFANTWSITDEKAVSSVCEDGKLEGQMIFTEDHDQTALCDKGACFSTDTEVKFGEVVKRIGDLDAGDGNGEILYVQHAKRTVRSDVLCVKNKKEKTLCATENHVLKY